MKDNSQAARKRRKTDAEARQAKYDALSTSQKIELATSRHGNSTREISRLAATLEG